MSNVKQRIRILESRKETVAGMDPNEMVIIFVHSGAGDVTRQTIRRADLPKPGDNSILVEVTK